MDVSGFIGTVICEIKKRNGRREDDVETENEVEGIRFQNHLYGCWTVLEMLGEGEMGGEWLETSVKWENIGQWGFYDMSGEAGVPRTSGEYRMAWEWAWRELGVGRRLEEIDRSEHAVFEEIDAPVHQDKTELATRNALNPAAVRDVLKVCLCRGRCSPSCLVVNTRPLHSGWVVCLIPSNHKVPHHGHELSLGCVR